MIEEVDGQGIIDIVSENKESIEAAKSKIKAITARPEVGEVYMSRVKSIMPYGAFVEIMPGKEGLLHISEIDWSRLEKVEDVRNSSCPERYCYPGLKLHLLLQRPKGRNKE